MRFGGPTAGPQTKGFEGFVGLVLRGFGALPAGSQNVVVGVREGQKRSLLGSGRAKQ